MLRLAAALAGAAFASGCFSPSGGGGAPDANLEYEACVAAASEAACTAAGGSWVSSSRAPDDAGVHRVCRCSTGEEGKSCQSKADCLAGCSNASVVVGPSDSCDGVTLTCEPTNLATLGCRCRYWYAGKVEAVCLD